MLRREDGRLRVDRHARSPPCRGRGWRRSGRRRVATAKARAQDFSRGQLLPPIGSGPAAPCNRTINKNTHLPIAYTRMVSTSSITSLASREASWKRRQRQPAACRIFSEGQLFRMPLRIERIPEGLAPSAMTFRIAQEHQDCGAVARRCTHTARSAEDDVSNRVKFNHLVPRVGRPNIGGR